MIPQFRTLSYKASLVADARLDEADGIGLILGEYRIPRGSQLSRLAVSADLQDAAATPSSLLSFTDRPGWDTIPAEHKRRRIVSFEAGSAIAPLMVQTTQQTDIIPVDPSNDRGIFLYPRFLRHAGTHPAITAVNVDADYQITLYQPQANGNYGSRQALESPTPDILQDARLIALHNGYLLFAQRFEPGDYRQYSIGGETKLLRTGIVEARQLNSEFKPFGPVWQPFGNQAILQFDADALNGRVAVFASTLAGWRLAIIAEKDIGHAEPLQFGDAARAAFSSPSVLVVGSGVALSLLADAGSDKAALWLGKWLPSQ